jgi:hypothetical protein
MNKEDLDNAENNIDNLFKLRDEIIKSSPYLADMKSRIQFYKKAIDQIPEKETNFLSLIETPINNIITLSPTNLDFTSITGATGSFYSVSGDTKQIITDYGQTHYNLITEYNAIKKTEELVDEILELIKEFRAELKTYKPLELLNDAKEAYAKWQTQAIDNSDLAKEIRAFQDVFGGCLNNAWQTAGNLKSSEFKWNKMAEVLGKDTGGCKNSLKANKSKEEKYHSDFSEILKKTNNVTKEEMDEIFKGYIEHLYSTINLIDLDKLK